MISAYLSCLLTETPEFRFSQAQIEQFMLRQLDPDQLTKKYLHAIYRQSGIASRFSVLPDFGQESPTYHEGLNAPDTRQRMKTYRQEALKLASSLLDRWHNQFSSLIEKNAITHLIWVSCTGLTAPGLEVELRKKFPENTRMQTTAFNFLGCHGFFHALRFAQATSLANPDSKILVICLELCTLHFQPDTGMDHLLANSLFADGAAAFLVSSRPMGPKSLKLGRQSQHYFHEAAHEMAWDIGLTGFEMKLHRKLPERLRKGLHTAVSRHFSEKDPLPRWWIAHPGGKKILEKMAASLSLNPELFKYSFRALAKVGNVSSVSVLFALEEMWAEATQPEGQPGLFIGVGPGLAVELASFEF